MSNIVERLRSPANVFYEYAADNGAFLREAADEILRLRAELAAVTEERDRMLEASKKAQITFDATWSEADLLRIKNKEQRREIEKLREALQRIDGMATMICMRADAGYGMTVETVVPIYETARAAIEGVTEKEG